MTPPAATSPATSLSPPADRRARLAGAKRVSWVNLVFGIGRLGGVWAILGVFADVRGSRGSFAAVAGIFGLLYLVNRAGRA